MSGEAGSAAHATKETFGAALRVLGKYLAPLAGLVAGFVAGGVIGGYNSIYGMTVQTLGNANASRVSGLIMAIIFAGIGGVFWHLRSNGGWMMEVVGGIVGGFFFGAALNAAVGILNPQARADGFIETLRNGVANAAEGR